MSALAVVASSHYLHGVGEGATLPSLDARLEACTRDRPRRIDRFIALAVLGSAECAAKAELADDCGLYLSSGIGPLGSNTQVQEQLCRDRLLPKPFNFVNTLGSAAGHYVARNLGLRGQNLFVATRGEALQTALLVAAADLELDIVSQALVGAVEECSLPLSIHRRRQGLSADAAVAEGTHWILVQRAGGIPAGDPLSLERFDSDAALAKRLDAGRKGGTAWSFAHRADPSRKRAWRAALAGAELYDPELVFHDSRDAALVTHWLAHGDAPRLGFVGACGKRGALVLELGPRARADGVTSRRS